MAVLEMSTWLNTLLMTYRGEVPISPYWKDYCGLLWRMPCNRLWPRTTMPSVENAPRNNANAVFLCVNTCLYAGCIIIIAACLHMVAVLPFQVFVIVKFGAADMR